MFETFISIIHVFCCLVLMFVVLLQQGKGGGMGSAFGGASAQVFGGSGAGNILTRATAICAGVFMLTSVELAHIASSKDSGLRAKIAERDSKAKEKGTKRETSPATSASGASSGGSMMNAPVPSGAPAVPAPSSNP